MITYRVQGRDAPPLHPRDLEPLLLERRRGGGQRELLAGQRDLDAALARAAARDVGAVRHRVPGWHSPVVLERAR